MVRNGNDRHTCRPLITFLENDSMVHFQTNANRNGDDHHVPIPTVLLENGSMIHNQTDTNRNGHDHLTCRRMITND